MPDGTTDPTPEGTPGPATDHAATPTDASLPRRAWTLLTSALFRGAIVLSVLGFMGYAMGLVRDRIFARTFGAGPELDAYNAAFVLPELALDVLVAGGLVAPFIPVFIGLRTEAAETARAFARTILTLAVVVMAVASSILFVLAPQTVALIAPGFDPEQQAMYVTLFRIMCFTPVIFAGSIVLGEILVANGRFFAYGLAPLLYNGGIVLGTVLLSERIGIYAAAVGAVAGALAHLGVRLVGIYRTPFRPQPSFAIRTKGVGEFIRLMIPKMVSHPIEPLTFLYFTALASTLAPGSVSSVSFARNFQSVPVSLIGAAFAISAFPIMSTAAAAGDRRGFGRVFGINLAVIAILTSGAALVLFLFGGTAIRILLGGGAFEEDDIARTTTILAVFAFSVPLEGVTHLLSRALYATHNTILPTIASISGFVVIVIAGQTLSPTIGLSAVPAAFAIGMAVKVGILVVSLAPRMARIGVQPLARPRDTLEVRGSPVRRRLTQGLVAVGLVVLAVGTVYATGKALNDATLAVAPVVTPWARERPPAAVGSVPPIPSHRPGASAGAPGGSAAPGAGGSAAPGAGGSAAPGAGGSASSPGDSLGPVPSPTPSGPFSMDLFQKGDFVREFKDIWCLPAAVQTAMNIMDDGADTSRETQARLFDLTRSLDPAPDGAAEPEGWAHALTELGYGNFEVSIQPSIKAAIHTAAKQIRLTGRPAGLMVWRGAHSWVMSGFTASADPALTDDFTVSSVRIEDVWYPRLSSIWGYSRAPDASYKVGDLSEDFLPWKRPLGTYPKKTDNYVIVVPVE
jgi:putative peptidoglycan lipid II flippase